MCPEWLLTLNCFMIPGAGWSKSIGFTVTPTPSGSAGGVLRKLLGFVHWAMVIAQLTHLHLTIPSSGSTAEPVPPEWFPVVPLSRGSAVSRRVSFTWDVPVIGSSPLLFSPVWEPLSVTAPTEMDKETLDWGDIQIAPRPTLFFPVVTPLRTWPGSHLLGFLIYLLRRDLF